MEELKKEYSEWEYEEEEEEDFSGEEGSGEGEGGSGEEGGENKGGKEDLEVEVEIDGQKQKVTLDELKKGYMRQADYTRKTQELAQLSKKDQNKVLDKAQNIVDNKEDYPEEDVKTAEYLIKIAKDKFGLMTREEYEAEKMREKQLAELESSFKKLEKEVSQMKGMPPVNQDELLEYMKETGIHNPRSAYLTKYESEYKDYILRQAKGSTAYKTDKGGQKIEPKEKKIDVSTDEGLSAFLKDEIGKIKH